MFVGASKYLFVVLWEYNVLKAVYSDFTNIKTINWTDFTHWTLKVPFSITPGRYNRKAGVPAHWIPAPLPTAGSCGTPGWPGRSQWPLRPGSGARRWRGGGEQQGVGGPRCWRRSSRHSCRGLGCRVEKKGRRSKGAMRLQSCMRTCVSR